MNSLFQIGAKLLGIFSLARCIMQISILGPMLGHAGEPKYNLVGSISPVILSIIVYFIFGYLLTFKTDFISKTIKADKIDIKITSLPIFSILKIGLILIGINYFIFHLPGYIRYISYFFQTKYKIEPYLIGETIGTILSILFIFIPDKILSIIYKNKS